jgi:hypothetical protein
MDRQLRVGQVGTLMATSRPGSSCQWRAAAVNGWHILVAEQGSLAATKNTELYLDLIHLTGCLRPVSLAERLQCLLGSSLPTRKGPETPV